jgi:cell division cycle 14
LGQLFKFCEKLNNKLKDARLADRIICFYSSTTNSKRANAIFLICAWQVLYMNRTPEQSYLGFCHEAKYSDLLKDNISRPPLEGKGIAPIPPFHDATGGVCTYKLTILHCLKGLVKARAHGFFNFDNFPLEEVQLIEQVRIGFC